MSPPDSYEAIVLGAGPGGLAAICGLLDADVPADRIVWIDRDFDGGRLNGMYREISSNTKVGIYLSAFDSSKTCKEIIDAHSDRNGESSYSSKGRSPVDKMKDRDEEKTCQLSLAGDAVMMFIDGIRQKGVQMAKGEVKVAEHEGRTWTVNMAEGRAFSAHRLILATGSHPIIPSPSIHDRFNPRLDILDLDQCMMRSRLPDLLGNSSTDATKSNNAPMTIGVIGNSHSGILVCRNLFEYALGLPNHQDESVSSSSGPQCRPDGVQGQRKPIKILNFHRRPIKYAIYRDDGIVNDNTGLKGATADWAKEVMEAHKHTDVLEQVDLSRGESEDAVYRERLPECTHIVYAIGYEANSLPRLRYGGRDIEKDVEFDMHTSGFHLSSKNSNGHDRQVSSSRQGADSDAQGAKKLLVPGLHGCGIAFPELVEDPEGNVEAAVGLAKFFKFTERVKDRWVEEVAA